MVIDILENNAKQNLLNQNINQHNIENWSTLKEIYLLIANFNPELANDLILKRLPNFGPQSTVNIFFLIASLSYALTLTFLFINFF